LLLDISQEMAHIDSLDDVLATMFAITTREMGAERGALFLNDPRTNELFSRIAEGDLSEEIRFPNDAGIAGHVFTTGQGIIVHDAYADERFNADVDVKTGYITKSILCVPVKTTAGETIGVAQALNKVGSDFNDDDLALLEALTRQAAAALLATQSQEMARPPFVRWLNNIGKHLFGNFLPVKKAAPEELKAAAPQAPSVKFDNLTQQISAEIGNEPAFQSCSTSSLARFLAHVDIQKVKRGETVHENGANADETYLIVDGEFKITSSGGKPVVVQDGFLGEEAGIGLESYVSTSTATKPSEVLVMPGHAVRHLAANGPLHHRLLASFSGRFGGNTGSTSYGERTVFSEVLESPRLAIGWILALLVPALVYWLSLDMADFPGTQAR
jgi:hypothetical protein